MNGAAFQAIETVCTNKINKLGESTTRGISLFICHPVSKKTQILCGIYPAKKDVILILWGIYPAKKEVILQ